MEIKLYIKYLVFGIPVLIIVFNQLAVYYGRQQVYDSRKWMHYIRNVLVLIWIIAVGIMLMHKYQDKPLTPYPGPRLPTKSK
ncbi:hypothetical protein HH214_00870 [Mucilaginibacter robiniae]|uniref:Uncharacterized protein n=1 Tax=Mucilaginibacter robiniae TaxID=2728022 RepID=A0A7L5E122_9SPHI|nr:hypothetical protein [Mucilaginibacter robiniae]QJD94523.1 hypothetical protein HH214_00870 [Mucilaginibacter robiniae]